MFTQENYATLTRSQRKGRYTRAIVKHTMLTVATVAAVYFVCDKVEEKLDSK